MAISKSEAFINTSKIFNLAKNGHLVMIWWYGGTIWLSLCGVLCGGTIFLFFFNLAKITNFVYCIVVVPLLCIALWWYHFCVLHCGGTTFVYCIVVVPLLCIALWWYHCVLHCGGTTVYCIVVVPLLCIALWWYHFCVLHCGGTTFVYCIVVVVVQKQQ